MEEVIKLNSVDQYNKLFGLETRHPLVTVVDLSKATRFPTHLTINYGLYALFLKHTKCGDLRYGRQIYDYQEGTVTSFAPGQVVEASLKEDARPLAHGIMFHPDLIRGTSLGQNIKYYSFLSYASNEALHLSEEEKKIFLDCLDKVELEISRPVDKHSKRLISRNIELMLDYCNRFYERQFMTRAKINKDVLMKFEELLDTYFLDEHPLEKGLPTVKYFAEKVNLSSNYFGDLVKKKTGKTPQEYIQEKIINVAKEKIVTTEKAVSEIAYELGFQYPQHFSRIFKKRVGCSPNEYRTQYNA